MSFGGGFMSGGEQSSQGRGGGGRKGPTTSLRPVTINQINKAEQAHPDADFIIDGVEIGHLTFVGRVMSVQPSSASFLYSIHDGTGTVDVRQWTATPGEHGGEGGDNAASAVLEHSMVRIVGQIKTFNNKKHVAAAQVRPIDDITEDLYHVLDVVYTHNAITKGSSTNMAVDEKYNSQADYAPRNVSVAGGIQTAGMPHLRRKIAEYFNAHNNNAPEGGIYIFDILKSCAPATIDQVREEVDNLIASGDLYSLQDDDHLASTG